MNELLAKIIDAHGIMERWNGHEKVDATIVSGGGLFPLKGVPQDSNPRRMTVLLHEERSSVQLSRRMRRRTRRGLRRRLNFSES
jgi:hypothetical protein